MLEAYSWPGNVRELQSVLKQAMLRATGPVLVPEFLPPLQREMRPAPALPDWDRFLHERLQAGELAIVEERLVTP